MTPTRFYRLPSADRSAILALQEIEDDACGGCGHPLSETTRPGASGDYDAKVIVCAGCASRDRVKADQPGALVSVRKVWDSDTGTWLVPEGERPAI